MLTSTALVAAVATIAMGLLANLPLALAAGMGLNSVVAFQLVATMHLTWPQAMGVVVAEGLAVTVAGRSPASAGPSPTPCRSG